MGKELKTEQLPEDLPTALNQLQAKDEIISTLKAALAEKEAEISTAQTEFKEKCEEVISLNAALDEKAAEINALRIALQASNEEIESSLEEITKLQNALEKSEDESTDNNTVEVDGQTYRILHGGMGLEGFEKFTVKDIQENGELAAELVKISFGGLELVSND